MVTPATLPRWDDPEPLASRAFGDAWQREKRSLLRRVPSYVARIEWNILINPEHPEFPQVQHGLHEPVWWDERLFPVPVP